MKKCFFVICLIGLFSFAITSCIKKEPQSYNSILCQYVDLADNNQYIHDEDGYFYRIFCTKDISDKYGKEEWMNIVVPKIVKSISNISETEPTYYDTDVMPSGYRYGADEFIKASEYSWDTGVQTIKMIAMYSNPAPLSYITISIQVK